MASRIKGITVEIGGDTVGLESALRDVNKRTKEVQSELKDVERLLKFNPNNVELLAQRQELLTQAIQSSTDKLNQLRAAQSQVEQQFRNGQIGEEQYRAFQRELLAAEQQVNRFQNSLQDMQNEQQQVAERTRQMGALFDATGTSVQDYANVIGQRLVRAIQNGTANSRDLEYAFQRIGRQAIGSNGDIERLRASLQTINTGGSIQDIRRDLQQMQSEADQAAESVDGIGDSLAGVAGALAAGGGIGASIEKALDVSSLNTKIELSMDIEESSMGAVKESVREVIAVIGEEEAALEGVRRQWALNKDASDETNASIIKSAAAITKSYAGIDFTELIQETNEIAAALKISNEDAIALTNSLLKTGFPPEQLDTIAEYGQQMKDIGFSTAEVQSIFESGINTKTWNIDNLNDGVKEIRLQVASFGKEVPKSLSELLQGTEVSTKQMQTWGQAVAEGGKSGSKAMNDLVTWLDSIDDKTLQNALSTEIFKTKWEDQGDNMIAVFRGLDEAVDKTGENLIGMQESVMKLDADPAVKFSQAMQDVKTAAEPALSVVAEIVSKIAGWIAENPKLAATIAILVTGLGTLVGAVMALAPILYTIFTGIVPLAGAMSGLLAPITGVVAAIAGLVAAGVLLYQNWETVRSFALSIWSSISEHFGGVIEQIRGYIQLGMEFVKSTIQTVLSEAVSFAKDILSKFSAFWKENGEQITAIVKGAMNLVASLISINLKYIENIFKAVWPIISGAVKVAWGIISTSTKSTIDFILGVIQFFLKLFKGDWSEAFETIKDTTQKIWDNIVDTFKSIDLLQIGKDIIRGLIKGIGDMASDVREKVAEITNGIPKTIRKLLGIQSPSKVTTKLGEHIGEGLEKGMNQKSNDVRLAAEELALKASPYSSSSKETRRKTADLMSLFRQGVALQ